MKTQKQQLNSLERFYLELINQLFELEKKTGKLEERHTLQRNLDNLRLAFEEHMPDGNHLSIIWENPEGESYDETRLDCEANIAGEKDTNLVITDVIKPIVRIKSSQTGLNQILQKGVVIVQSKEELTS